MILKLLEEKKRYIKEILDELDEAVADISSFKGEKGVRIDREKTGWR